MTTVNHYFSHIYYSGGFSGCLGVRYSEAYPKFMPDTFDSRFSKSVTLLKLDVTGLYSSNMLKALPIGGFTKLSPNTILKLFDYFTSTNGIDFKDDSEQGLLLVVDLCIPDPDVARMLDPFPPCVYPKDVEDDLLSPYMKELKEKYNMKTVGDRLIGDLLPKFCYPIAAMTLKAYMRVGVKLLKIHSGFSFRQKPVMKNHIQRLAELRQKFTVDGLVSNAQACKKMANR